MNVESSNFKYAQQTSQKKGSQLLFAYLINMEGQFFRACVLVAIRTIYHYGCEYSG